MTMPASIDRLSSLPEEVIGHILSFLPSTSSFMQTSILAKQWRLRWTRVPGLRFFTTIDDEFSSWIDNTTTIFARNIVIRLNHHLTLPRRLFTSTTLVDLCIIDSGNIRIEDTVYNFPALKKLRLVNVGFDSENSLPHLISGCPLLEELIIDGMVLNYSYSSSGDIDRIMCKRNIRTMQFDKPTLRYLRLRACHEIPYIWSWELHSLDSLIEADIDMISEGRYFSYSCQLIRDFLPKLCNVKRLTLSSRRIEAPTKNWIFLEHFNFPNLTELNLRAAHWCFVLIFLTHAKNLRVLTIHRTVDHNTQCWIEPLSFLTPLNFYTSVGPIHHLETLNLFDFEWSTNQEFEMVEYILRNAQVLKSVELIYTAPQYEESDWNHKVETRDRLAAFEKGSSSTCSIRLRLFS